jgi:serralysin
MKRIASLFAATLLLAPASAFSFAHLWEIQEIYTNATGSVQFVELFTDTGSSEIFLSGQTLSWDIGGVHQNTMTFSNATATDGSGDLSGSTLNKSVLIGTANLGTFYGIVPDYIIPANFLTRGAVNSVIYSASSDRVNLANLPTDGVMSLNGLVDDPTSTAINSQATPTNFAGQTFTIPEPRIAGLIALGSVLSGLVFARRRRS